MNLFKVFKVTVISAAVLGAAVTAPSAFCNSAVELYALFQCSNRAYIQPVPAPFGPPDVQAVFWQIGFGNNDVNSGLGTDGTGVQSKSAFNGNDSGNFPVNLLDADAAFPGQGFPPGAICLGSNNWSNANIDGCCDNPRPGLIFSYDNQYHAYGPYNYNSDDNILNPYFATYFDSIGFPGYYSIGSMMDYPTAVLVTTPGQAWFSLMAVTNLDRNNDGTLTGPCNAYGGTNTATCDLRQGYYPFDEIANGLTNPITGAANVVPWQTTRPRVACLANCSGAGLKDIQMDVGPVRWYHDAKSVPSNNPTLATRNVGLPRDAANAEGVGVVDLLRKWNGLVRYTIESAPVLLDPNGNVDYASLVWTPEAGLTDLNHPLDANGDAAGPLSLQFQAPSDTCYRAVVSLGRVPIHTGTTTTATACRDGGCGDVGYTIASSDPLAITCVGGALVSENIASTALDRSQGVFILRWTTSAELSVDGFDILAVDKRGKAKIVADATCAECTSGLPGNYRVEITRGDLRGGGVEAFRITMRGGNGDSVEVPVTSSGRAMGRR